MNPQFARGLPLAPLLFLIAGCHSGPSTPSEADIRQHILDATGIDCIVPATTSSISPSGDSATATMSLAPKILNLSSQDRQQWADNLHLGEELEKDPVLFEKEVDFTWGGGFMSWRVNAAGTGGTLNINEWSGTPGPNNKITSTHTFALTPESNTFALNWLASHPN